MGYVSPKPFSINEYDRCIDYDISVVEGWLVQLSDYINHSACLDNMKIMELGPGSDLGVGLYLLSKGIAEYNAVDCNNLESATPTSFYEAFFDRLYLKDSSIDIDFLRVQLDLCRKGKGSCLKYRVTNDFIFQDIIESNSIDIIFSQAAFEHFDDIPRTIAQISNVAKSGAILIAEIDLKTHSRWIRDKDPLNIYRYGNRIYYLFSFKGIPNRVRPKDYARLLELHGWIDIKIKPLSTWNDDKFKKVSRRLNSQFRAECNQMNYLSCVLCARKL